MPGFAADTIVVHYNEIALKLGHRRHFVTRLIENLRATLAGLAIGPIRSVAGRVIVEVGRADPAEIGKRLALTPGVANLWCARALPADLAEVESELERVLSWWRPRGSFRIEARRGDKSFPVQSPEIAARLGELVVKHSGARVDLKRAETVVYVLVVRDCIYLALEKIEGCGGLPVSTGGRVLLLLSGGIDSPVAGLRMMRRGCRLHALHFHSVPYLGPTSLEKARRLCAVLARGQGTIALDSVAFGEIQSEIVRVAPTPLRVVLYRRMMMRIAAAVAREVGAAALVTGESLGQVASQTLTNMTVIAAASTVPLLRPLVGMDKREIIDYARSDDTYAISVVPDQDCCTLFVPRHPATSATLAMVEEVEGLLDVGGAVAAAVAARERCLVEPAWSLAARELAAELS